MLPLVSGAMGIAEAWGAMCRDTKTAHVSEQHSGLMPWRRRLRDASAAATGTPVAVAGAAADRAPNSAAPSTRLFS